jgi:large subunit ribosomal protein L24e
MVDKRTCSFCGTDIEPGTGKMYVKRDGTKYNFCSNKCQKNMVDLKRVNRNVKWTTSFERHPGPTPPKGSNQPEEAKGARKAAKKSPQAAAKEQ